MSPTAEPTTAQPQPLRWKSYGCGNLMPGVTARGRMGVWRVVVAHRGWSLSLRTEGGDLVCHYGHFADKVPATEHAQKIENETSCPR